MLTPASRAGDERVKLKLAIASLLLLASTGCVVVGGYSSGRGFWLWPGSIVFVLIGLFLLLMMVFRRR
jgi:fatty acid desaturase